MITKSFTFVVARIILLLILLYNLSFAQTNYTQQKINSPTAIFYLSIPYTQFTGQEMESQGVGDGFGWLGLGLNAIIYNYMIVGTEIGWDRPEDNAEFTNNTTSGKMTSGITLWSSALFAGLKIPEVYLSEDYSSYIFANMNFGIMWAYFEKREIENCLDCDSEELNIDGGLFINPEIYYVIDGFGLGFSYKHFFNSDYKSKFVLKLSGHFN